MQTKEEQPNQLALINEGLSKFDSLKNELIKETIQTISIQITEEGHNDKANFNLIVETRKNYKKRRIEIEKAGKALRDQLNPIIKMVSAKENELVSIIEPEEKRLAGLEKELEAKQEEEREKKRQAEHQIVMSRLDQLAAFGIVADYLDIKLMAQEDFNELLSKAEQEHEAEQERIEAERIEAEKKEAERIEAIRIQKEKEEQERIKLKAEQEALQKEREEFRKQQEEAERKAKAEQEFAEKLLHGLRLQGLELIDSDLVHEMKIPFLGKMSHTEYDAYKQNFIESSAERNKPKDPIMEILGIDSEDKPQEIILFNTPVDATISTELTKNEVESFEVLAEAIKQERFPATDEINESELEITFDKFIELAKRHFIKEVNAQEWNTKLRTAAESFINAYDQLYSEYQKLSNQLNNK